MNALLKHKTLFKTFITNDDEYKQAMTTFATIMADEKFKKCSQDSIAKAIADSVRLGLDPTPGIDHTYLVPYFSKGNMSVQLQISAKGYTQMLYRAGWLIETVEACYNCDDIDYVITEAGKSISFRPNFKKRQLNDKEWIFNNLHSIMLVIVDAEGRKVSKLVSRESIEKLRLSSPGQTKTNQFTKTYNVQRINQKLPVDIWNDWYEEMALTKGIKLFAKRLPIGDKRISQAIKLDDLNEAGIESVYDETKDEIIPIDIPVAEVENITLQDIRDGVGLLGLKTFINDNKELIVIPDKSNNTPNKPTPFTCKDMLFSMGFLTRKLDGSQYWETYMDIARFDAPTTKPAKEIKDFNTLEVEVNKLGLILKVEGQYSIVEGDDAYNQRSNLHRLGFRWAEIKGFNSWNMDVSKFSQQNIKKSKQTEMEISNTDSEEIEDLKGLLVDYGLTLCIFKQRDKTYAEVKGLKNDDNEALTYILELGFKMFNNTYIKNISDLVRKAS